MRFRKMEWFTWSGALTIAVLWTGLAFVIYYPTNLCNLTATPKRTCLANLKQIDAAKELWAMANHKPIGTMPKMEDLAPAYMKHFPSCPSGGSYTINSIGKDPTCAMAGHAPP